MSLKETGLEKILAGANYTYTNKHPKHLATGTEINKIYVCTVRLYVVACFFPANYISTEVLCHITVSYCILKRPSLQISLA